MRVKRGTTKHRRHKKILKLAKGYRMTYSKLYRRAKQAVMHAGQYSYNDRKHRVSQFRTEWIKVIAANLSKNNYMSYSKFISALTSNSIFIDRKVLADLAVEDPKFFDAVYAEVK